MKDKFLDVEYISRLARIDVKPDEVKQYEKQLTDVVEYMHNLDKIDLTKLKEKNTDQATLSLREDKVLKWKEMKSLNDSLSFDDQYFKVPPILG
jgi:aspartyl/glutamyl-tRNA(Asn/Gln) amidotransferase C subunit